jgi:Flp pilus assembly protein TadG
MVIELALITPVLLIVMLGILDFGRVFYSYMDLTNAARAGARYAAASASTCDQPTVQAKVQAAQSNLAIPTGDIALTCNSDRRTVTITNYPFVTLVPFSTLFPFLGTISLSTVATFPLVNQ